MTTNIYTLSGDSNCASYIDSFSGIIAPIPGVYFLDDNFFNFGFFADNSDTCSFITKDWGVSPFASNVRINNLYIIFNQIAASSPETVTVGIEVAINVNPTAGTYDSVLGSLTPQVFVFDKASTDVVLIFPISKPFSDIIKTAILNANFGVAINLTTTVDTDALLDQIQLGLDYSEAASDSTFRARSGRDRLPWGVR